MNLPSLKIGGLQISWFAVISLVGWTAGVLLSAWRAHRRGDNPEHSINIGLWMLIMNVLLGRLFFVLNPPPSAAEYYDRSWYISHLFDMQIGPLALWHGGLSASGRAAGAALGLAISIHRRKVDLHSWLDIIMPGALLSLAILPWGNVVNGQMFGPPTRLVWGLATDQRVGVYADISTWPLETRFHPVPIYLSLWAVVMLAIVLVVERRRREDVHKAQSAQIGLTGYATGVLALGLLHVDVSRNLANLSGSQLLAVIVLVGVGLNTWRKRAVDH